MRKVLDHIITPSFMMPAVCIMILVIYYLQVQYHDKKPNVINILKKVDRTRCERAGFGDSCQLQKTGFTSHFTENHLVRKIYHHLRGENPFFYFCVEWELCFRHANSCRIGYYRPSCIICAERRYFLLSSDSHI